MPNEFDYSLTTIIMFIILILLTGALMVEHSRFAIIPLIIGTLYGARMMMKYLNEVNKKNKVKRT